MCFCVIITEWALNVQSSYGLGQSDSIRVNRNHHNIEQDIKHVDPSQKYHLSPCRQARSTDVHRPPLHRYIWGIEGIISAWWNASSRSTLNCLVTVPSALSDYYSEGRPTDHRRTPLKRQRLNFALHKNQARRSLASLQNTHSWHCCVLSPIW